MKPTLSYMAEVHTLICSCCDVESVPRLDADELMNSAIAGASWEYRDDAWCCGDCVAEQRDAQFYFKNRRDSCPF
jgi:hypothetical protein